MLESYVRRCPQAGATVRYRIGRKLVGDRTEKSRLQEVRMTDSQFVDDVTVRASTREALPTYVPAWRLEPEARKLSWAPVAKQLKRQ